MKQKSSIENIFSKNVPGVRKILAQKTVAIAGLGGLGSNVAVALTRAGIGKLIIADFDKVELSNLNRQYFFIEDVGKKKTEAISRHLKNINPVIVLKTHFLEITRVNINRIFKNADLMIEAFDRAENKAMLIEAWSDIFPNKTIICASGLAGFGKTSSLQVNKVGKIIMCGDGSSDMSEGLISSRVAIVANMQANEAIEILVKEHENLT